MIYLIINVSSCFLNFLYKKDVLCLLKNDYINMFKIKNIQISFFFNQATVSKEIDGSKIY